MPQKPLNKSAMARWAVANCSKAKPTSGNPNVLPDYYDFSLISDSYDCTNFVSHAVLAGGATMSYSGSPSSGWYFSGLNYRSYSWSGVVSFYEFLVGNTGTGPFGVDTELCGSGCEIGDIIQFFNGTVWRHSTVITGFAEQDRIAKREPLVTGRTAPGVFNLNQPQSTVYPGERRRVIHLIGYR